jgi:hypothetical protein
LEIIHTNIQRKKDDRNMNLKWEITHNKFQTIIDGYLMSVEQYFVMVFNATFNNISTLCWQSVCIGGGNRSTRRKPPTCRKSLYERQMTYKYSKKKR